ncbi:MAG: FG-GAP-like repeat-containing protein, partial [Bacteroidota bacterium]
MRIRRMSKMMLVLVILFVRPFAVSSAQVILQLWTEVYGTTNGEQLGNYVTGIASSANLPMRAAVSSVGSTGVFSLQTQTDTSARQVYMGENLLTGDLNNDGYTDVAISKTVQGWDTVFVYWGTVSGIDTLNPLRIAGEFFLDGLKPSCIGDVNNDGKADLLLTAPEYPEPGSIGKIYVYLNPVMGNPPNGTLAGESISAGFGLACAIGDLNADGYNDLIIRGSNQTGQESERYDYLNVYWGIGKDSLNLNPGLRMKTKSIVVSSLACFDINGDGVDDLIWTTQDSIPGPRY